MFAEFGALGVDDVAGVEGVLDFDWAVAADGEAVVGGGSGGEGVDAEAGGGVVDFELVEGVAGLVFYGGLDPVAFAAAEGKKNQDGEGCELAEAQELARFRRLR